MSSHNVEPHFTRDAMFHYTVNDTVISKNILLQFVHLDYNKWGFEVTLLDTLLPEKDVALFSDTLEFGDDGYLMHHETAYHEIPITSGDLPLANIHFDYSEITQIAEMYVVNRVSDIPKDEELDLDILLDWLGA